MHNCPITTMWTSLIYICIDIYICTLAFINLLMHRVPRGPAINTSTSWDCHIASQKLYMPGVTCQLLKTSYRLDERLFLLAMFCLLLCPFANWIQILRKEEKHFPRYMGTLGDRCRHATVVPRFNSAFRFSLLHISWTLLSSVCKRIVVFNRTSCSCPR